MTENQIPAISSEVKASWRSDTKREWSDEARFLGWRTWGRRNIAAQVEATQALLDAAGIQPDMHVLDVAGGGGDPSLALAVLVGPLGRITVTDVSEGMLETARQFAVEDGLTNIDYHLIDTEWLPFSEASFDAVTCRCGVMFFADHDLALREIGRVLKPGGRAAFLAWGPLDGIPLFTGFFQAIQRELAPPAPVPGAPGPFKFAAAGSLSAALQTAGFEDVRETHLSAHYRWPGSPDEFMEQLQDMGGLRARLAELPSDVRDRIMQSASNHYQSYSDGSEISMHLGYVLASATIGGGTRP